MADKNFKVKKNIQVTDLAVAGPVTVDSSGIFASSSALPVNLGGTGQTSASAAFDALVPSQTNNANKLLGTNGTSVSWVSPGIAYQTSAPDSPVTGQLWVDSDETGDSLDPYIIRRKTITATAGQTVFTTDVVFTDGYEQIYYNGVLLVRTTDYTTSGGTNTVTLLQGASAGDTVEIISATPINLVNTLAANSANTITAQTASSVPLTIEGAASQSASLFNIKNSAGETRHEFLPNGNATFRGTSADQSSLRIERYTDDLAVLGLRSIGGTISSPTAKTAGTRVGMIVGDGYDGTNFTNVGRITFWADGPVTTGNIPGSISFNTVPVGGGHAERMRITSAGNVGIGTSSPSSTLHVAGGVGSTIRNTASSGSSWFVGSNVDSMIIHNESNTPMVFTTNGTERMRINSDGKVDIRNTANPTLRLIENTSTGNPTIQLLDIANMDTPTEGLEIKYESGTGNSYIKNIYSLGHLIFQTAGATERMRISANGSVSIVGSLSKGSGSFKIDHPLPELKDEKYLVHSFIEGPQADLIYRGVVELVDGSAEVNIDQSAGMTEGTFLSLCRDIQCFTSNESDWDAVRGKVNGNILEIESINNESTAKISWMVVAERKDQHMYDTGWTDENGKVIVEPLKELGDTNE